jgi:hypothetical protein
MPLTIDMGNSTFEIAPDGDLAKYLSPGIDTVLHLDQRIQGLAGLPNATLANSIEGSLRGSFGTKQQMKWDLGSDANVAIVFQPDVSGTIQITKSGPIFTYFEEQRAEPFEVSAPEGHVYVSVTFEVTLDVGGKLAYSAGNFGIKASLTREDTFRVTHHCCFPEQRPVKDAIRDAFDRFKLPLLPQSIRRLDENEVLDFEFVGKLSLGAGLTYGLSPTQIGGRGIGDISRAINTPLARSALTLNPTIEAGATFGIKYEHEDAFRFVFAQDAAHGEKSVSLTILRSDRSSRTTQETAGITVDPGLKFDFGSRAAGAIGAAANQLLSRVDQGTRARATSVLTRKLQSDGKGALDALASFVSDSVNGLFQGDSGSSELKAIQERVHTNTALFRFHFDPVRPGVLENAVSLAMRGQIADAVTQDGVELDPGSLVENEFVRRATFGFQIFGLWKWSDVLEYLDRVDVIYAGNGYLRLVATEGVREKSGVVGRQSDYDVHFLAEASEKLGGEATSGLAVTLQFALLDKTREQASATARILAAIGGMGLPDAADSVQSAFHKGFAAVRTTCAFVQDTFSQFTADPYKNGKPGPLPHTQDADNYRRFAEAVAIVNGQFLGFPTYDDWAIFNRVVTDQEGSTKIPDRKNPGNLRVWPQRFSNISDSQRENMRFYSESARCFMNFCEDLRTLATTVDEATTDAGFESLVRNLSGIVNKDVPASFIKATLLALIKASGNPVSEVQTERDGTTLSVSFSATGVRAVHA